jgi:Ran GTPase-activating protein 1
MASSRILSLDGRGLKLNTRQDLEPWLRDVDPSIIEEIHFGGNTIGVEASQALAQFLDKATAIKVRMPV